MFQLLSSNCSCISSGGHPNTMYSMLGSITGQIKPEFHFFLLLSKQISVLWGKKRHLCFWTEYMAGFHWTLMGNTCTSEVKAAPQHCVHPVVPAVFSRAQKRSHHRAAALFEVHSSFKNHQAWAGPLSWGSQNKGTGCLLCLDLILFQVLTTSGSSWETESNQLQ